MSRVAQRVQFQGHAGNMLAGILEQPSSNALGYMLFSHCFTCNKDLKAIVRICRSLADRGWGVLRYDFSGLGNSQGDFSRTNFSTNREDMLAAVAFLTQHFQRPQFLIGHSFGGAASLSLADELVVAGVVTLGAPSDTYHLAALLLQMDENIGSIGHGQVTIGGRTYPVLKQMVDDFRSHDLRSMVSRMKTPLLAFHSPVDETVGYHHALINCGFDQASPSSGRTYPARSLVTLHGANHLLTNQDADCPYVAELIDSWSRRQLGLPQRASHS